MTELLSVVTGDWDCSVEVAEACSYSAIFIRMRREVEAMRRGTEQQEGHDISKEGKCK